MQKKKIGIVIIIVIIVTSIFFISIIGSKRRGDNSGKTIQKTYNLKYSEAYSKYINLPEEEKHKLGVVPRMYDISLNTLESTQLKTLVQNTPIQSYYSLADTLNIKVENQGNYGTCWAFASLNSLETNLAIKTGQTYDFSESHIDHTMSPAFGNNERNLHEGGMFYYFMEYVMSDYGPVLESSIPYETSSNQYGSTDYEQWKSLKPTINLLEIIDMPTIDKKNNSYTDSQLTEFRSTVKAHIINNGSLYASIYADDIKTYNGKKVLKSNTTVQLPNHAVTIIGWDDNFAISNFPASSRPSTPGAYIALNSWGSDWGENGIFYISYEDVFVESEMSGVVSTTTTFDYVDFQVEDEAFYQALKEELNAICIQTEDDTKKIKIKTFTQNYLKYLMLDNRQINSIEGIQGLKSLYYIDLSNNNLTSVTPILQLTNLGMLKISGNKIGDLADVFNSSLTGLNATSQNIIEKYFNKTNEVNMPPLFYQGFYINDGSGVSVSAKIYYNCNENQKLDEQNGIDYTNINVNASTGTAKILLDKEVTDTKPTGNRAIQVTITDTGFVDGSTYTFYYDVPKGDINNDEKVDSIDAYLTLQLIESGNTATTEQLQKLDMNLDGKLTKQDAYLVLEKVVE